MNIFELLTVLIIAGAGVVVGRAGYKYYSTIGGVWGAICRVGCPFRAQENFFREQRAGALGAEGVEFALEGALICLSVIDAGVATFIW